MKELWKRINNTGTILAIGGAVALIVNSFYPDLIDTEWLNNLLNAVCSVLICLGVLNNPKAPGAYVPFVNGEDE